MTIESKNLFLKWPVFIKERFSLSRYPLLILFFFLANSQVALEFAKMNIAEAGINLLAGLLIILFAFLHLRILDEVKDYKEDIVHNKNRPLARGLISLKEAKIAAGLLIILELILSLFISLSAFTALIAVVIYSIVMYKEFFMKEIITAHHALYVLTHTFVACFMSLFIYSSATGRYFWFAPREYIIFVFANWAVFNVFEYSRKMSKIKQKKDSKDILLKAYHVSSFQGAVIFWSFFAIIIAFITGIKIELNLLYFVLMGALLFSLIASRFLYKHTKYSFWGRITLKASSSFILFYNVIIVFGIILKR
jgi:4-hydroxybenzoate polyprenyltransferase